MNFHWPFFHRDREDVAALEREIITLRTQVVFATDMLAALKRRPHREVRKDAASFKAAKATTTAKLQSEIAAQRYARLEPVMFAGMGKGTP